MFQKDQINSSEWKYFAEGLQHIILQYIGAQKEFTNKVLILKKQDYNHKYEESQINNINQYLSNINLNIAKNIQAINKHCLVYQQLQLGSESKEQCIQDLFKMIQNVQRKRKQPFSFNINSSLKISQNLFKIKISKLCKETVVVQFKPKSIMPSKFSLQMIKEISDQLSIQQQLIVKILNESPLEQKTRWFKSSIKKKHNKLRPLDIFTHSAQNYLRNVLLCKPFKNGEPCSIQDIENQQIYDVIINKALKQTQVLKYITKIQKLSNRALHHYKGFSKQSLINHLDNINIQQIINNIKQSLISIDQTKMNYSQIDEEQLSDSYHIQIVKLLVSRTWQDVSLIIQTNIIEQINKVEVFKQQGYDIFTVQNITAAVKIRIIDYDSKPVTRILSNYKKQVNLLKDYIKFKLSLA